jgi:nicotinamide-nucleotide amidase
MVDLEIICVGNELLIGKVLNTNAHWLAKEASALAVKVTRITVIQDTLEEISNSVCASLKRKPDFIVTTGGLGPTFDDKTLEGIAKALDRKLILDEKALEMVKTKSEEYARKKGFPAIMELTKPRLKMATIPQGSSAVHNPLGTAPGVQINISETVMFALPGVPSEMEAIFNETIAPMLKQACGNLVFCQKSLFADNIAESTLAPSIDITMADNAGVYIKSHPLTKENRLHIELHFTITANISENPCAKIDAAILQLSKLIHQNGGEAKIQK